MNREEVEKERIELCNFLLNESRRLEKVNTKLQDRIDKAIEYIENNSLYKEEVDYDYEETPIYVGCNDIKAKEDLLDILKGNNNE